jgi:hypothetical protein
MRVVFWNIRAGGGVRVGRIAAQLERWTPDVVALCEFRATPPSLELARSLASLGLQYQCTTAEPARPSANRLLIATRFPMRGCGFGSGLATLDGSCCSLRSRLPSPSPWARCTSRIG